MIQVSSSPESLLAKRPRASQPGRLITAHRPSLLSRAATCSTASNLSLNPDRAYPPRRHDPRRRFRNQRRLTMLVRLFDEDRKSTRLNSSHQIISYAVFCLKKKKKTKSMTHNSIDISKHDHSVTLDSDA